MPHIMLDLETMGTRPDAAIVAVGAVHFDPKEKTILDKFYKPVDLASSMRYGGTVDADTVKWWLQQSEDARKEIYRRAYELPDVLTQFSLWVRFIGISDTIKMWGNGAAFDNVVLRSAYGMVEFPPPWLFRGDRCFRTVKATYSLLEKDSTGIHHNALDDAVWQAEYLMELLGGKE